MEFCLSANNPFFWTHSCLIEEPLELLVTSLLVALPFLLIVTSWLVGLKAKQADHFYQ